MSEYYLMNKNFILLSFEVKDTPLGTSVAETPFSRMTSNLPIGYTDIHTWVENRNYAKHKTHFMKWLNEWGINNTEGFLNITHCLGINDTLWVKPIDSDLTWEKVNLYSNDFSDVARKTAFDGGLYGLQLTSTKIQSPEFTSEGTAPKCWKKEDDGIYLYKSRLSGASNFGLESNSEFISSVIANQITKNSILYDIVQFQNSLCSKCKLFSDEDTGFVPFYKFIDANRSYTLQDVLNICTNMGYEKECREMIFVDSIIFNQDRHLGNFGFLVRNDTFEIKGFAPLFDFNQSLLCNALTPDICSQDAFYKYEEQYQVGHKLGGRFETVGKAIATKDMVDAFPDSIIFPKHSEFNLDESRTEQLIPILSNNISQIVGRDIKIEYSSDYEETEEEVRTI